MLGGLKRIFGLGRPDRALVAWPECFIIGEPGQDGTIRLHQRDSAGFDLGTRVEYRTIRQPAAAPNIETPPVGVELSMGLDKLNLEERDLKELRVVRPHELRASDLASVPAPFRWWANSYGLHTPAALIHDKFIGETFTSVHPDDQEVEPSSAPATGNGKPVIYRPAAVTDAHIDRYFRFMLMELGFSWLRRWVMWAAVAGRSRFEGGVRKRTYLLIWVGLALAGIAALLWSQDFTSWWLWAALLLPIPASGLWGKQAGAGLIIAYFGVPLLLTPALVAVPAIVLFALVERVTDLRLLRP